MEQALPGETPAPPSGGTAQPFGTAGLARPAGALRTRALARAPQQIGAICLTPQPAARLVRGDKGLPGGGRRRCWHGVEVPDSPRVPSAGGSAAGCTWQRAGGARSGMPPWGPPPARPGHPSGPTPHGLGVWGAQPGSAARHYQGKLTAGHSLAPPCPAEHVSCRVPASPGAPQKVRGASTDPILPPLRVLEPGQDGDGV